jgi:Tol biopolymer transport system component
MAQPFDLKSLTLSGEPFPIAERVQGQFNGHVTFSVSDNGTLVYGVGGEQNAGIQLTWVDRQGKTLATLGTRMAQTQAIVRGIDLSPDGKRVAEHDDDPGGGDIWITDERGAKSRFTFDAAQHSSSPIWSPDGQEIVFGALQKSKWGLYKKASSGAGNAELLMEGGAGDIVTPMSWAPDRGSIVYLVAHTGNQGAGRNEVWIFSLTDRKTAIFGKSDFNGSNPQVSPDGKWIAYTSYESGRGQIYVRPFPSGAGKWQVSITVGNLPRWRGDSKELFFVDAATAGGNLLAAEIRANGASLDPVTPKVLFPFGYLTPGPHVGGAYHVFAVSRDGQRFLIPRPTAPASNSTPSPIAVVLNWPGTLRK